MKIIRPDLVPSKKRKINKISKSEEEEEYVHKLLDEFEHESTLANFYSHEESKSQKIMFDQFEEFEGKQ